MHAFRSSFSSGISSTRTRALGAQLKNDHRPDFRPGFHAGAVDTTELVKTWRARLFGDHGTLNDQLIGATA